MSWAGHSPVAYLLYMPIALAGLLVPMACAPPAKLRQSLLGYALLAGAVAEAMTRAELGGGYVLATWAFTATILVFFLLEVSLHAEPVLLAHAGMLSPMAHALACEDPPVCLHR